MVYMAQQGPPGFNPAQGNYNWQPARTEMTPQEMQMYQAGVRTDPMLDFFHKHPHFVKFLMQRFENMVTTVLERILVSSGLMANQLDWVQAKKAEKPNDPRAPKWAEIERFSNDTIGRGQVAMVPQDPDNPNSPRRPQSVTETMDLESEHFFELLTDEHKGEIMDMNQQNHDWALSQGVYHADPTSQAQYSPFGTQYQAQNGQWAYQPHAGNQYGNQGHPQGPPMGQHNPYSGALGVMASFL